MKNLYENLKHVRHISDIMNEDSDYSRSRIIKNNYNEDYDNYDNYDDYKDNIDEGLKDIFSYVKSKFQTVFEYFKKAIAKIGRFFVQVDEDGIIPSVTPMTTCQVYKDGVINSDNTCVIPDKQAANIVGLNTSIDDAKKLYGTKPTWEYRLNFIKESCDYNENIINEVKLAHADSQSQYNVISDNKTLVKYIKMRIMNPSLAPLLIWGAPGIGKTAVLNCVAESMKSVPGYERYNLIVKTLSNETPDNFTLPNMQEIDGQLKATDIPKEWLPVYKPTGDAVEDGRRSEACGKGLLFIDELSRATPQVLNVLLPLLQEKKFNGYVLGSGWTVVCASNRMEDEFSGQTDIGAALSNRFAQVHYEPTFDTWKEWAEKQKYISPVLLSWLGMGSGEEMSGSKYFYWDPNEDDPDNPTKLMCSPRAWDNAMRTLACWDDTCKKDGYLDVLSIPTEAIKAILNESIPAKAIDSFVTFLELIKKVGSIETYTNQVWSKGSAPKVAAKDMNIICGYIGQTVCASHYDELPTEKEFDNFVKWLVSENNSVLAASAINTFFNVFYHSQGFDEDQVPSIMFANKIKEVPRILQKIFDKFKSTWKINKIPDYSKSMSVFIKKYQSVLKDYKFNGEGFFD